MKDFRLYLDSLFLQRSKHVPDYLFKEEKWYKKQAEETLSPSYRDQSAKNLWQP